MTRIIAGAHGGRRLTAPPGAATRPTSDRVREALFSALESTTDLRGARFLDLYAGSGAVGLEAVSRGAAHALLVESEPRAAQVARTNVTTLGLGGVVRVRAARVSQVLADPPLDGGYDVVFADPPYAVPPAEVADVLRALLDQRWLTPDAVVVLERSSRTAPGTGSPWVDGITALRSRRYGETTLWYGRRS